MLIFIMFDLFVYVHQYWYEFRVASIIVCKAQDGSISRLRYPIIYLRYCKEVIVTGLTRNQPR